MRNKWFVLIISALLFVSLLSGCNFGNDDIEPYGDLDNQPARYGNDMDLDVDRFDVDRTTPITPDRGLDPADMRIDRDMDLDNRTRGFDLDLDRNNIRRPNEMDTPFNMDEEEPDLDEEPTEELD